MSLTEPTVAALLAAQGYDVPDDDLAEIAQNVRRLVDQARTWDAVAVRDDEPWPVWPTRLMDPVAGAAGQAPEPEPEPDVELAFATATEQARRFRAGEATPVDLVRAYLERIERLNPRLNAFVTVCADDALHAAERATEELRAGTARSPLHGIPFAVKDQMLVAGVRVTGGSRLLADFVADRDATAIERLKAAGALFLVTLNTHEFHTGMTRNPPYGEARNPWTLERSPGASSSGPAAAVAAGLCSFSLGGDTGGSIRGPAAFCNLVGVKPTWGRVSRDGVFPLYWASDCVGPLTRSARDAALVTRALAGLDPRDPTSSAEPVADYAAHLSGHLRGVRVAVVEELMDPAGANAETLAAVAAAVEVLRDLGADVHRVRIPLLRFAQQVNNTLVVADAASYYRTWLQERYADFDVNTRVGYLAGAAVPAGVVALAGRMRTTITRQVLAAFGEADVLVGPAADAAGPLRPTPPTPGAPTPYKTPLPQAFSLAGVPALSVPCGITDQALPLGMTLAARHFDEATLFRAAHAYERATPWHGRWPTP
jgi:aspartyl-tRNA(Asn)/glutamyl-tRNA(Gln) amidotransferase subunit A